MATSGNQQKSSTVGSNQNSSIKSRNRVLDFCVYLLVRTLMCILQALPPAACVTLSRMLAFVMGRILRFRHRVVDENLRHAFPQLDAAGRSKIEVQMWQHLMMLLCEIATARRKIHETNWREYANMEGTRTLVRCILSDDPVMIVTSHLGNFEASGYVAGILGFPTVTVARPLDNPYLHKYLADFRESTGQSIISSRGTADLAESELGAGATLSILGDHYGGAKGCWVDFLNRPASCHKSIGLFALSQRARIVVFNNHRRDRLLHFQMYAHDEVWDPREHPSASISDVTEWFTQVLERDIRDCPGQYWWLHRRWKDTRQIQRRRRRQVRQTVGMT